MANAVSNAPPRRWRLHLPERLPDPKGWWLTAYTIVWAVLLVVAIVGPVRTVYSLSQNYAHPAWQPYGIATGNYAGGIEVAAVLSSEALGAGIRPGDRITEIDGWKVPAGAAALTVARARITKPEGSQTRFTFAAPGEPPHEARLTFTQKHFEDVYTRAGLTVGLHEALLLGSRALGSFAFVASAVLLFIRGRKKAVPAYLSLAFLIAGEGWASDWSDLGFSNQLATAINLAGWALLVATLFALPSGRFEPSWSRRLVVALPLLPLMPLVTNSNLIMLSSLGVFLAAAAAALIIRYLQLPGGAERQQLRWVFSGFVVGSAMLILDILGLLVSDYLVATDPRWFAWRILCAGFGALGITLIALGLMVSILRYRLYDADTVIGRSAAYGILTIGFVGLFAGSEKLAELVGERYFEHSIGIAAGAIGAAIAAVCIVPLHNRVHRWAERRFQKPLIRLREGLPECVADLRDSASVAQIAEAVMKRVEAGVHSTREAVLLREGRKWRMIAARKPDTAAAVTWQAGWREPAGEQLLDCDRKDAQFPVRVRLCIESGDEPETIGWLLLGPRPDGSLFGKDDREALERFAGPVARALHIAQLRERREKQAEKRLTALETLIARFTSTIGGGSAPAAA